MCKRVWIRDHGKVYHTRRTYIEEPPLEKMNMPLILPKYRVRESPGSGGPLKLVRSKTAPVVTTVERSPSSSPTTNRGEKEARSHPVKFGIPFLTTGRGQTDNDRDRDRDRDSKPRHRHKYRREEPREERTARPFVVEAPEEYRRCRRQSRPSPSPSQSPSPSPRPQRQRRTRSDSPRRARSPTADRRGESRRRPREPSPVTERVPLRRSHRVVEVHNHERPRSRSWSRTRDTDRSHQERRVRFASDDDSGADDPYIIKERPARRHREPSPWPDEPDKSKSDRPDKPEKPEKHKPGPTIRNMPRPRIVQDGCQRVSGSTANTSDCQQQPKIELRRPRSRSRVHSCFRRGTGTGTGIGSLEPESEPDSTVVCDTDHWRYGGRWR